MVNIAALGWLATIFSPFLYSFSQIDLGLTLTQLTFWQSIQTSFQTLGYFNRPLSTQIYLVILTGLFAFYFLILRAVHQRQFSAKKIWFLVWATAGILWLSYNAFSYDLFNYIFDAKIVTFYHQNPYLHKALDFPTDPMLGFMHWTHRVYPYGPIWLGLSIPVSFLGFQKFLLTAILFKGLATASYLGAGWFIFRILQKTAPKLSLTGLAVFAFNPLMVMESLVSAHNDIVMMALVLAAIWFVLEKKYLPGWLVLLASIGIKFATGILAPLLLWQTVFPKKAFRPERLFLIAFFLMLIPLLLVITRTEIQPWYLLYLLPFVGLLPNFAWLFWPLTTLSLGLLLSYVPLLSTGTWPADIPQIKINLALISLVIGVAFYLLNLLATKMILKKNENRK